MWQLTPPKMDLATRSLQQALSLNQFADRQERIDTLFSIGMLGWWQSPREEIAYIPYWQKVIELDPNHADGYLMLGRAYLLVGDWEYATLLIRRSIEIKPDNEWAYLFLGDALMASGKPNEARTSWKRALYLSPDLAQAQERLDRLGNE